jgi:hypothetical protein
VEVAALDDANSAKEEGRYKKDASLEYLFPLLRIYVKLDSFFLRRQFMCRRIIKKSLFITVLFALLVAHSFLFAQDEAPFVGTWKGAINIGGMELGIVVEFSLDAEKNIQGNIDVPDQNAMDLPLGDIQIEGRKISFKIVHPGAPGNPAFSGELDETSKKISGEFSQGGATGTFSIEKE